MTGETIATRGDADCVASPRGMACIAGTPYAVLPDGRGLGACIRCDAPTATARTIA